MDSLARFPTEQNGSMMRLQRNGIYSFGKLASWPVLGQHNSCKKTQEFWVFIIMISINIIWSHGTASAISLIDSAGNMAGNWNNCQRNNFLQQTSRQNLGWQGITGCVLLVNILELLGETLYLLADLSHHQWIPVVTATSLQQGKVCKRKGGNNKPKWCFQQLYDGNSNQWLCHSKQW